MSGWGSRRGKASRVAGNRLIGRALAPLTPCLGSVGPPRAFRAQDARGARGTPHQTLRRSRVRRRPPFPELACPETADCRGGGSQGKRSCETRRRPPTRRQSRHQLRREAGLRSRTQPINREDGRALQGGATTKSNAELAEGRNRTGRLRSSAEREPTRGRSTRASVELWAGLERRPLLTSTASCGRRGRGCPARHGTEACVRSQQRRCDA